MHRNATPVASYASRLYRLLIGLAVFIAIAMCWPASVQAQARRPAADAQVAETLGSITFFAPAGWTRKASNDFVSFETTDARKGQWAVLGIYRDTASVGSPAQDFASQWQLVVGSRFKVKLPTEITTNRHPAGYEIKSGGAQVSTDAGPAAAILLVASGHGVAISTLMLTNSNDHVAQFDAFIQRVTLNKPAVAAVAQQAPAGRAPVAQPAAAGGSRPAELVGTWVNGSASGPPLYDRGTGAFVTLASGSSGQLELRANGTVSWARMMRNNAGCGMAVATFREGTWQAGGGKVIFHWTSGDNQFTTCGTTKRSKPSVSTEEMLFETHVHDGTPKLGLHTKPDQSDNTVYALHSR